MASPPARPYSIVPQSCGILCLVVVVFFCHIKPPISRVRASRVFWSYSDYGQPASLPLFNSSAELRNFVFGCFLPYQTPYLAEYGSSRVVGFANYPKFCRQIKSTGLSRILALLLGLRPASPLFNNKFRRVAYFAKEAGYYQTPISRVRPIHVGGISNVKKS